MLQNKHTDGRNCRYNFSEFQFIQNCCLKKKALSEGTD